MKIGLRERQKAKRAQQILRAASLEFSRRGYGDTRIEDIAARAGVAPATVYNYFNDKGGILIALFQERFTIKTERLIAAAKKPFKNVLDAVDHFLDITLDLEFPSARSDLWREVYAASFAANPGKLGSFVARDDYIVHEELVDLFVRHRARGSIPADVEPKDLADLVFAIGTYHWMRWVNGEVKNVDDIKPELKRQCRLALSGVCRMN